MEDQIQLIPLLQIDRPVKISRETIDPERVRELAESIRESGLIEPVILRRVNGRYEMVAGDRRFLAHKLLGFNEIKSIVRDMDDQETIVVRGIENLQRENLSPSEEGMVYLLLNKECGLNQKQICRKTGKAEKTVSRLLHFAQLPEEIRRPVDQKAVSLAVLDTLLEIDDETFFRYYFQMAVENGISEKVARMWVDDWKKTKQGTYNDEDRGVLDGSVPVEQKPIYITCEVCHEPIEVRKVKHVISCPECKKKVIHG